MNNVLIMNKFIYVIFFHSHQEVVSLHLNHSVMTELGTGLYKQRFYRHNLPTEVTFVKNFLDLKYVSG